MNIHKIIEIAGEVVQREDNDREMTLYNSPRQGPLEVPIKFLKWAWENYRSDDDEDASD